MERTLKQGPHRTVVLEPGREPRVVKRFHGGGLLGGLRDRRRARREHAALVALAERGLPVPEALALEQAHGRWQVVTRWIEGAQPLHDLLGGAAPWPCPGPALARRLGALLGRAHAAGVRQTDLHGGNVLIDPRGRPWLVDAAGVRLGPVTRRAARADLARGCALLRERTSALFRARALIAWRRAAPRALAALAGGGRAALELERAGRRERARALLANEDRWTRPSGLLRAAQGEAGPWLVRRGRAHDGPGQAVFERLRPRRRRLAFARLGRLFEHGLAVPAPARLAPARAFRAEVDGLEGFGALAEGLPSLGPRARHEAARALGQVCGALRERGFDPAALAPRDLLVNAAGELLLAPDFRPRGAPEGALGALEPLCAALLGQSAPARGERALFAAGFRRALLGAARERRAWMRELVRP